MLHHRHIVAIGAVWLVVGGCDNLSDFSTPAGECYKGDIIDAQFVRSGSFAPRAALTLDLDVAALDEAEREGTWLTTDDGLFNRSPVKQMAPLSLDSLSLFTFPNGRVKSYLAYAPDVNGDIANVVVSLMENGDVEVRIFRPEENPDESLFGVFRASRSKDCSVPNTGP